MNANMTVELDGKTFAVYVAKGKIQLTSEDTKINANGVELSVNGIYYDADRTERWTGTEHYFSTAWGSAVAYYSENQSVLEFYDREEKRFFGCYVCFPQTMRDIITVSVAGTLKYINGGE